MEVTVKSIPMYYEEYGTGIPVLMLHGWPVDHRHMIADMEPLFQNRPGWRRIYPDMPGFGKTPAPEWITNQDQMLEIASEFIRTVAPGQRFVVVGTSYGGYLARGFVYRQASLIDGVFMLNPSIEPDPAKQNYPPHQVLAEDPQFRAALSPQESYLPDLFVVHNLENLEAFRTHMLPAVTTADHAFLNRLGDDSAFSFPVDELTTPFPAPALIITGRQDAMCGYREAWQILDNYPRATFAVIDRAGHSCPTSKRV
ncbi:MAG TPA: alpha/beta hydrolase [Chloroflexia bacterium]|nr:alpha/beta hydrolase [Chloroflexia bacterium]